MRNCASEVWSFGPSRNDSGWLRRFRLTHCRHTPRMRGIQYAAAYPFDDQCLWNTGSSAFYVPGLDIKPDDDS